MSELETKAAPVIGESITVTIEVTTEIRNMLKSLGYSVQSEDIALSLQNALSGLNNEYEKIKKLKDEFDYEYTMQKSQLISNNIDIVGFIKNDPNYYAVYIDKRLPYQLMQSLIIQQGDTIVMTIDNDDKSLNSAPIQYIFNNKDKKLLYNYENGNTLAYFIDTDNKLITIEHNKDGLFSINHNEIEIRKDLTSYSMTVSYITDIFPQAQQIDVKNMSVGAVITEHNFKTWVHNQIDYMTCGKMAVIIKPVDDNDKLSTEQIIDAYNEYLNIIFTDKGLNYMNFEDYVLCKVVSERQEEMTKQEISIMDYVVSEGLRNPQMAEFIKDYTDGSDMGIETDNRRRLLEIGGYQGQKVAGKMFLDKEYYFNFQLATSYEYHSNMNLIKLAFDISHMTDNIYNNQIVFEDVTNNALAYLVHQQGHTVDELYSALLNKTEPAPFIQSIVNEIGNIQSEQIGLALIVRGRGAELINKLDDVLHGMGDMMIEKDAIIGLFNIENGSFIGNGIKLDETAFIPSDMVKSIHTIDEAVIESEKSVPLKLTFEDALLTKENMSETRLNLKEAIIDNKYKNG